MKRAVVIALVAACADVPEMFLPKPEFISIETVSATNETVITTQYYVVRLPGSGVRLPTSLTTGGQSPRELLVRTDCLTESQIGLSLYPAITVTGMTKPPQEMEVERNIAGPGVVRVTIVFDVPYSCAMPQFSNHIFGATQLTFLPSGRIERADVVRPATSALEHPVSCGCMNLNSNYYFTTFWTFTPGQDLDQNNVRLMQGATGYTRACSVQPDVTIGIKMQDGNTRYTPNSTVANSTFVYDMQRDVPMLPELAAQTVLSSIAIGPHIANDAECSSVVQPLLDDPLITVDGIDHTASGGIYDDSVVHTSAFRVKSSGTIPRGFALAVDVNGAEHLDIRKGTKQVRFSVQNFDNRLLLWIDEPMAKDDELVIEPIY